MDIRSEVLVILCGGLPAPGVNGVISAVTIEAINNGFQVIGVFDGFQHLKDGLSNKVHYFSIEDVSSLHDQPGSFLRTSKDQIRTSVEIDNALRVIQMLRASYLVTVGGAETAHSAYLLVDAAKKSGYKLQLVHVPKTIFNDLPLPPDALTFGYSTARDYGVSLVRNLRTDAKTLGRYYIATIMGQRAGHLALGIGKAAAATCILIPEEFEKGVTFQKLCDIVESLILKRLVLNRHYGIIIFTEGLVELMDPKEIQSLFGNSEEGHLEIARMVANRVYDNLKKIGKSIVIGSRYIGSELRAAAPNATDIELSRDLGYCAVRYLLDGGSGSMITLKGGHVHAIPLEEVMDVKTGFIQIRTVDKSTSSFEVSQKYQIRLTKSDLKNPSFLFTVQEQLGIKAEDFITRFQYVAL